MPKIPLHISSPTPNQIFQPPRGVQYPHYPYALASKRGMIDFGKTLASVGSQLFEEGIRTQFHNDRADFLGKVAMAEGEFSLYAAQNPGATHEELLEAHSKMIDGIEKAGQGYKIKLSKEFTKNWLAQHKGEMTYRGVAEINKVKNRYELERFNALMEDVNVPLDQKLAAIDAHSGTAETGGGVSPKQDMPEFVTRMEKGDHFIKNPDGTISTHKMAYAQVDNKYIAYPTVVNKNGKLVELSDKEALKYALENKEYLQFVNEVEAARFAKGSWKAEETKGRLIHPAIAGVLRSKVITAHMKQSAEVAAARMQQAMETDAVNMANMIDPETGKPQGWGPVLAEVSSPAYLKRLHENGLPISEAKKVQDDIKSFATIQQAAAKQERERAVEASKARVHKVVQLPSVDEFLAEWPKERVRINKDPALSTDQKEEELKKGDDRVKAIKSGDTDPLYEYDVDYYNDLMKRISNNPRDVSESEINNAAGRGKNGGITAGQDGQQGAAIRLKRFLQDDIANNRLFSLYSNAINTLQASKAFHQNKKKNAELASEARILMNAWAVAEPRTEQDYETFYNGMISKLEMSGLSEGVWYLHQNVEQKRQSKILKDYVRSLGVDVEVGTTSKYKKGDVKIINGETWTFNGKDWNN